MKKRLLLLTYSFFLIFSLQAQIHYFVEASGNMSLVPKSEKVIESNSIDASTYTLYSKDTYNESYKNTLGGNIMVGLQYDLKNSFSLESGVELSLIKFNRDFNLKHESKYFSLSNIFMPTPPNSYFNNGLKSDFSLSYLSIPVSVFYQLVKERFYVGAGVVPGVLVHASNDFNNTNMLSKLTVAAQVQARFKMTEKISVIGAFQQYLSPIFKEDFSPNKTKNRLVKLGLRYDL
jgi:hypothetical protein